MVKKDQVSKVISFGSHGRSMGHRGTDDPACQVEAHAEGIRVGRHARSLEHDFLPQSERVPMGYAAA